MKFHFMVRTSESGLSSGSTAAFSKGVSNGRGNMNADGHFSQSIDAGVGVASGRDGDGDADAASSNSIVASGD